MKDIQDVIDVLAEDKLKKNNLKNIMNMLTEYQSPEKLKKYKSFIHDYINQKYNELEVM